MIIVCKNGIVIALHEEKVKIDTHLYPDCEIFTSDQPCNPGDPDPRTLLELANEYMDRRRQEYPSAEDQLDMIYWDQANGTTTWRDALTAVKSKYPKPPKEPKP